MPGFFVGRIIHMVEIRALRKLAGSNHNEKARAGRARRYYMLPPPIQMFPPVAMKNIAARRAPDTMRHIVRNGRFDFTVSL